MAVSGLRAVLRRQAPLLARHLLWPLRVRARRRLRRAAPGSVTVVIVTWQSWSLLEVALAQVARHSPPGTAVLVVDNHSDVDPRPLVRRAGARAVRLPVNVGHGLALDVGVLLADTELVVVLDVDAFPFDDGWLEALLGPLAAGAHISGCQSHRAFAHPCCSAMRRDRFLARGHTFVARFGGVLGETGWDVGERISMREAPHVAILRQVETLTDGHVGQVFEGGIYHNGYGTRHRRGPDPAAVVLDGWVTREAALRTWDRALERFGVAVERTPEPG